MMHFFVAMGYYLKLGAIYRLLSMAFYEDGNFLMGE